MREEQIGLVGVERERVFPDVALLPVAVLLDDVVVRMDREPAVVVAEDALEGEGDAAVAAGVGRVVAAVREQILAGGGVDAQQRVAEHRRRVVHVRFG